jgi:hypothetical protein
MSTQPHTHHPQPAETEITRTTSPSFATRNAPFTFSPHNTDPCPQMFSDKWTAGE